MPNRIYEYAPVQIPNRAGKFCGHYNHFSGKVGTLIPCLTDLLIPNTNVDLSLSCQVQLPPMAADFFGHIDMKFEAFFVPLRLCYGGFQDMITHVGNQGYPSGTMDTRKPQYFPYINLNPKSLSAEQVDEYGPGTLADYLGIKAEVGVNSLKVDNPTSFVAYHLIWQEWYRNPFIEMPAFQRPYNTAYDYTTLSSYLPYVQISGDSPQSISTYLNNGRLYELRQRNWAKDYFTNAKPSPQAGDASQLAFSVDTSTGNGSFTIASLRSANALQLFLDRNNIAGFRYADQIRAHFGVRPSDAVVDRPIYIGSQTVPVYTKGISQTAQTAEGSNRQPFDTVGTKYGQSVAVGNGNLGSFHTTEYGYLMVIASLVPRAIYSSGSRRYLKYNNRADFATPLLQGVGDQVIDKSELLTNGPGVTPTSGSTFGYVQRYAEYKDMVDEVHGLLQDGQSLDMFTLQRSFSGDVQLSSDFIKIPTNYLDQVAAVESSVSQFGYWCDVWFDYNKVDPLSDYSIPTLGDPKNTHTEVIPNGGVML